MAITSADIAKLAGVSRSAVSAVLNGHYGKVSLEKRERILRIAGDMRYHPNRAALALAHKSGKFIGIIAAPFFSAIYSELIAHLSFEFAEHGYACSIATPDSRTAELEAVRNFESSGADGIAGLYFIGDARGLAETCAVPMISMAPYPEQFELRVDLRAAMRLAVGHFREHGHDKIALLCPAKDMVPLQTEGYLSERKNAPAYILEVSGNSNFDRDLNTMLQNGVTAFCSTNDLLAARFIRCLTARKINVPHEAAVIGFDGSAFCETLSPTLATMVFPARALAERCAELLLEKIESGNREFRATPEFIAPAFMKGESCGCEAPKAEMRWSGVNLLLNETE